MENFKKYRKRARSTVIAVQLDLDTEGFTYEKWGGSQRCRAGDWLVKNGDDTYTVAAETFASTYHEESPGVFEKRSGVWAARAEEDGTVRTQEGTTAYKAGDYVVFNDGDENDRWAVGAAKFEEMYVEDRSGQD